MSIVSENGNWWDGEELFFCRTCGNQLPKYFNHDSTHDIIPLDWVTFCGHCNRTIEKEWSYCAWCGQHLGDW